MRNAIRLCRMTLWAALLVLALLPAGCRNAPVFPNAQTQESRLEHVTTASFEERVLKCEKPVLVDFYADWCVPCSKLGPVLEEFAQEHPEVRVVKVNVDENSDLVSRYGVQGFPTLLLVQRGKVTKQSIGFVTKQNLVALTAM